MKIKPLKYNELDSSIKNNLAEFLELGFQQDTADLWKKRFDYWWKANPNLNDDDTICWYLYDDETDSIEGFIGKIPITFQYKSRVIKAAAGTSWYASEKTRGAQSTRLFMKYNQQKDVEAFLDTTPTAPVQKMLPEIDFVRMGEDKINNYMIVTHLKSFSSMMSTLLTHFAESETGAMKNIFVIGSKIGNIASKIIPKSKSKLLPSHLTSSTHELHICKDAKTIMQYLSSHSKGDVIEVSKDETTLNWMFFSPEVKTLLQRKIVQVFTKSGEYCGYFVYDIQQVGKDTVLRMRELQLLQLEDTIIKLIIQHMKIEAKNNGCAAVYSGLQSPDAEIDKLLHKNIFLSLKTDNRYYVKFRKGVVEDVDPYSIYKASDLDPDVGFI